MASPLFKSSGQYRLFLAELLQAPVRHQHLLHRQMFASDPFLVHQHRDILRKPRDQPLRHSLHQGRFSTPILSHEAVPPGEELQPSILQEVAVANTNAEIVDIDAVERRALLQVSLETRRLGGNLNDWTILACAARGRRRSPANPVAIRISPGHSPPQPLLRRLLLSHILPLRLRGGCKIHRHHGRREDRHRSLVRRPLSPNQRQDCLCELHSVIELVHEARKQLFDFSVGGSAFHSRNYILQVVLVQLLSCQHFTDSNRYCSHGTDTHDSRQSKHKRNRLTDFS
mmetsp:Transcript_88766/g.237499  ORF Transcript_88766/g.237499 Transcript_88766/m.237499 type:complete len:285 (+) Transcript_88766:888-1742(+)